MKLADKFKNSFRFLFSPGAASFDDWRHFRVVIFGVILGILAAVGFGFLLYYLNAAGRF